MLAPLNNCVSLTFIQCCRMQTLSDAFTRMLESVPATYELYLAAKLEPVSLVSGLAFTKALFTTSTTRSRWLLGRFSFATIYVLIFPVLFGATTGYFTPTKSVWVLPGGTYMDGDWENRFWEREGNFPLATLCIVIENGQVVNLPPNATILPPFGERDRNTSWSSPLILTGSSPYPSLDATISQESQLWRNLSNCRSCL